MIRYLVLTNSGTTEDANDVFQEAMAIIFEKVRTGRLVLTCSFSTYLYSVCSKIWLKELNSRSQKQRLPENMEWPEQYCAEEHSLYDDLYNIYLTNLQSLKPAYRKVLKMFLDNVSMESIALTMGYKNKDYAKVKKYLGKELLKKRIRRDPRYKEVMSKYAS